MRIRVNQVNIKEKKREKERKRRGEEEMWPKSNK